MINTSESKTSWSDSHLTQLTDPNNHRIRWDRVGYIWEHKLDGRWELHSIFKYREHSYYYHLIRYWVYKWSKELMQRRVDLSRNIINGLGSLYEDSKKINEISKNKSLSLKEKIDLIRGIVPNEPLSYVADALNISLSTLKRTIRR